MPSKTKVADLKKLVQSCRFSLATLFLVGSALNFSSPKNLSNECRSVEDPLNQSSQDVTMPCLRMQMILGDENKMAWGITVAY